MSAHCGLEPGLTLRDDRLRLMNSSQIAQAIDELINQLIRRLPADERFVIQGAQMADEWLEAIENLILSIREHRIDLPADQRRTLDRIARGLNVRPLGGS
jgi:hypothetical protein